MSKEVIVRKTLVSLLAAGLLVVGASPALAGPKEIIEWLKDPCIPTGDLENDCRLPF